VFADASILMKLVLWALVAAIVGALVVWITQALRPTRRAEGAIAYLSAQGAAAPLVGFFGLAYALLNGCIGIADVRPTPSLTVLAPGLAEAMLSAGLGLLAAAIAVIGCRHLQARLAAAQAADATSAARHAPLARATA
jgi:biopolymer transport protein ExbB/TolQ